MALHLARALILTAPFFLLQLAPTHSIEDVEKKLIEAQKGVQTYAITMDVEEHHQSSASTMDVAGTHVYEWARRGDDFRFRMEQATQSTTDFGGKEKKSGMKLVYAYDGQYLHEFTEHDGGQKARRLKQKVSSPLDAAANFQGWKSSSDVTVLADATVCGRDCFVIEQMGQGMDIVLGKREIYFCKQTGITLKTVDYNPIGEPFRVNTCTDLKVNIDIPESRFELELPPGVTYEPMIE